MFWKKKNKELVEAIEPEQKPEDFLFVGEPVLNGGKKFYPVYKRMHYYSFQGLGTRFVSKIATFTDKPVEYYETKEEAQKSIDD